MNLDINIIFAIILGFVILAFLIGLGLLAFKSLSVRILKDNNQNFLDLAQASFSEREQKIHHLVEPLQSALEKLDTKIQDLEKNRISAYSGLSQQVRSLLETQLQ